MDIPSLMLGTYRHYKGNLYQVDGVGCHSETNELYVVYRPLYEHEGWPDIWLRPYDMFVSMVESEGKQMPRFELVAEND
jgi:hypothetical protein